MSVRGGRCGGAPTVTFQTPSVVHEGNGKGVAVPVSYNTATQTFDGTFTIPGNLSAGGALFFAICDRSAGTTASFTGSTR